MGRPFEFEIEPFEFEAESDEEVWSDEFQPSEVGFGRTDPQSVRWVQQSLNRIGRLRLPTDGILATQTRSALRSFQRRAGVPVTGEIDELTEQELISALEATDSESVVEKGETSSRQHMRDYVVWLQRSLNRVLRLEEDGILGARTRHALRHFQQIAGIRADGKPGPETEAALVKFGASPPPGRQPGSPTRTPVTGPSAGRPDIVKVDGIWVARQIGKQVQDLLEAARRDGIRLGGWGYRSPGDQINLRKKHCGTSHYDIYEKPASQCNPPTAPPGQSMHERGLAIDFTYEGRSIKSRDNPGFIWLSQNAHKYGLKNLPSEPWHWSTNGR